MDQKTERKWSILANLESHSNSDKARQFFDSTFSDAKKVSNFVGFIVRVTFLFAAGSYFFRSLADQDTSFHKLLYAFCGFAAFSLSGALLGIMWNVILSWGLAYVPWKAGTVVKSIAVSMAFAAAFFTTLGSWTLANALVRSSALLGGN